jgi:uncharacterized protein (DUF2267 family)
MADFLSELAEKSGISVDQAKHGLGALLNILKDHLPANMFSQVQAAVPGSESLMAAAEESSSGSGLLEAVKGMAGKLFGGGGSTATGLATLQEAGVSAEQGQSLLRNVLELLKDKLPEGVMKQISDSIPAKG